MITKATIKATEAKASKALSYYLSIVDNAKVSDVDIIKASKKAKAWASVARAELKAVEAVAKYDALVKAHGIRKVIYLDAHMQYIIEASEATALAMVYKLMVDNLDEAKAIHDVLLAVIAKVEAKAWAEVEAKYNAIDASAKYYKHMLKEYTYNYVAKYLNEYNTASADTIEAITTAKAKANTLAKAKAEAKAELDTTEAELTEAKAKVLEAKNRRYSSEYHSIKLAKAEADASVELALCSYNVALAKAEAMNDDTVVAKAIAKVNEATDYYTTATIWAEAKAEADAFAYTVYDRYLNAKGLAKLEASFTYTAWAEVVAVIAELATISANIASSTECKYNEVLDEINKAEAEAYAELYNIRTKLDTLSDTFWAINNELIMLNAFIIRLFHYNQIYSYFNNEATDE